MTSSPLVFNRKSSSFSFQLLSLHCLIPTQWIVLRTQWIRTDQKKRQTRQRPDQLFERKFLKYTRSLKKNFLSSYWLNIIFNFFHNSNTTYSSNFSRKPHQEGKLNFWHYFSSVVLPVIPLQICSAIYWSCSICSIWNYIQTQAYPQKFS